MDYKEQMKQANENNAFMIHNGVRAVELSETAARVEMDPEKTSLNSMGGIHAGLMFLMAEAAAGLLVRNDGRTCVTIDSSFRFLRSAGLSEDVYKRQFYILTGIQHPGQVIKGRVRIRAPHALYEGGDRIVMIVPVLVLSLIHIWLPISKTFRDK